MQGALRRVTRELPARYGNEGRVATEACMTTDDACGWIRCHNFCVSAPADKHAPKVMTRSLLLAAGEPEPARAGLPSVQRERHPRCCRQARGVRTRCGRLRPRCVLMPWYVVVHEHRDALQAPHSVPRDARNRCGGEIVTGSCSRAFSVCACVFFIWSE